MSDFSNLDDRKDIEMDNKEEIFYPSTEEENKQVETEEIISEPIIEEDIEEEFIEPIISEENVPIKKEKKRGKLFSYISVAVVCAMIGGISGSISTYYIFSKTNNEVKIPYVYDNISKTPDTDITKPLVLGGLSIPDVVEKVASSVVGISVTTSQGKGYGSGIVFSAEGYILTNYHVIEGSKEIEVDFIDNTSHKAKVVNYDASLDVAVIKITDKVDLSNVAELGDSSTLRVGDTAIAIGSPLGKELKGSVTVGVISAINRNISAEDESEKLIQTDAAINAGNSGGALVNIRGQVIGINVAKIGGTQIEGLGFAIPINEVKSKINDLLRPILMIGIQGSDVTEEASKQYDLPIGVYVSFVESGSAAEEAGLKKGDVITSFDGKQIKTIAELNSFKLTHKAGDKVSIKIVREGKTETLDLTLKEAK